VITASLDCPLAELPLTYLGIPLTLSRPTRAQMKPLSRPLSLGSLGVHDMDRAGLAPRMRWLWYCKMDQQRAWTGLELQFSQQEQSMFFTSTHMLADDGRMGRFWEDR
jgi:hypothetical protein